jgi:hypothetical protein
MGLVEAMDSHERQWRGKVLASGNLNDVYLIGFGGDIHNR